MKNFGPILIVEGPNNSKVPYSRSLYINCSEKVLIDTGADPQELLNINEQFGVNLIINTHYHPDHTQHNHLFKHAKKWINPIEYHTSLTIDGIAKSNGIYQEWGSEGAKLWQENIPKEWIQSLSEIDGTYAYEKEYSFGGVNVIFLHTPGHTKGFSCPYFPNLGIVYTGDYDMTSFGPWYNGTDGSIDDFIKSGQRLLNIDADIFITGHQKGVFTRKEFKDAMLNYLSIIDMRDEIIAQYVQQGMNFDELTSIGIFYPQKALEHKILRTWERGGIRKHLHRIGYTVENSTIKLLCAK